MRVFVCYKPHPKQLSLSCPKVPLDDVTNAGARSDEVDKGLEGAKKRKDMRASGLPPFGVVGCQEHGNLLASLHAAGLSQEHQAAGVSIEQLLLST